MNTSQSTNFSNFLCTHTYSDYYCKSRTERMEDMMGSHVLDHPEEEGCTEKDTVSW